MSEKLQNIVIDYTFVFPDGTTEKVHIELNPITLKFTTPPKTRGSAWTRLKSNQCEHCPVHEIDHPLCPVAWRIEDVLSVFSERFSFDPVNVTVETPARSYSKETTMEVGFSSLLGILMASSGCPTMSRLKPLVRYHLPFATADESVYRVISWYLMEQYLKVCRGEDTDWSLKRLVSDYDDIREVNQKIATRLQTPEQKDSGRNAVVRLDGFAHLLTFSVGLDRVEDLLQQLERAVES